jgi:hypothetical protein
MNTNKLTVSAFTAPNQFFETNGRRLAYRSIGTGRPIVLCTRFRSNMDVCGKGDRFIISLQG